MRPKSAKMHRETRLYYGTYHGIYTPGIGTRVGPPVYRRMEMLFGTRVDHMAHPGTQWPLNWRLCARATRVNRHFVFCIVARSYWVGWNWITSQVFISNPITSSPGGTRSENWWGCAAGRWKLDLKRSREKLNLGPKRSNSVTIRSFNTPKDRFGVGGWEKSTPKRSSSIPRMSKKGGQNGCTSISPNIEEVPSPGPQVR